MRVLAMTKIFPNALEPLSSPFNRQQFAALAKRCELDVLAAIPWFPGARAFARWSAAGRLHAVPPRDVISGLRVAHPRFVFLPKVGQSAMGLLYAASLWPHVRAFRGQIDVLLGSWAYPDGFAAVLLAQRLGVPAVVKLHGSDLNVIGERPGPRRNLRWALPRASRVVAVSRALGERALALGVSPERLAIVPNGVDDELFRARDRAAARAQLGLRAGSGRLLLYVGRLEREKGVLDLLSAFETLAARRDDLSLALIGGGSAAPACRALAARLGDRVLAPGARPLEEIPHWMAAADLVTLPSWNEGTPNVLLEALACGRPVVATRTGGIPDVVASPTAGELVAVRDVPALAAALERVADAPHDAARIALSCARGGWDESAGRLFDVLSAAYGDRGAARPTAAKAVAA